jgi:hypothetical protein
MMNFFWGGGDKEREHWLNKLGIAGIYASSRTFYFCNLLAIGFCVYLTNILPVVPVENSSTAVKKEGKNSTQAKRWLTTQPKRTLRN